MLLGYLITKADVLIVRALAKKNNNEDKEEIFKLARKIVVAEWQHIIYSEWLPLLLGPSYMQKNYLTPKTIGYSDSYDKDLDPRIFNEFAGAAFRFGHSMIPTEHPVINKTGYPGNPAHDFRTVLDKPSLVAYNPHMFDDTVRGQTREGCPMQDGSFADDITNHLFENGNFGGLDLTALNIQRGRDHGNPIGKGLYLNKNNENNMKLT